MDQNSQLQITIMINTIVITVQIDTIMDGGIIVVHMFTSIVNHLTCKAMAIYSSLR